MSNGPPRRTPAAPPDNAEPSATEARFGQDEEPGPWGRPWGWWREIAHLLPTPTRRGRRADTDLAAVVAAILYKQSCGCPWRRLPERFPPWQTVYSYHRRWLKDGTLRKIREKAREADDRSTKAASPE